MMREQRMIRVLPVLLVLLGMGLWAADADAQRRSRRRAKRDVIQWATNFETGWVEAKERGCPVVLFFIQDGEPQNEDMVHETLEGKEFVKLADRFVCMIASRGTPSEHREISGKRDGQAMTLCKKYKTVTCVEHQELEKEALLAFFDGYIDTPHTIVCLPDRTVVGRFDDYASMADVVRLVKRALDQTGASLSRSEYLEMRDGLKEATDHHKARRYSEAWEALEDLLKMKPQGVQLEKLNVLLDAIRKEGDELLKDAEVKIKLEKYGKAVEILERTIKDFKGTTVHRDARKRLNQLKKDPEVVAALKQYEREAKAEELVKAAAKEMSQRDYVKAAQGFLRVLEFFEGTEAAIQARDDLDDLIKDARSAASIKRYMEGEAQKRLRRGEGFLSSGQTERARKTFRVIVELFAGTPAAKAAEARLTQLD